jgi:hypothetical protein
VDARFLLYLFDTAFLLAVAVWLGAILYLFSVLSPLFSKIPDADFRRRWLRTLLGEHYLCLTCCAAIALAAMVCGRITHNEYRGPFTGLLAIVAISSILITTYGHHSLGPIARGNPVAGPSARAEWSGFTRRDVILNGLSLILGSTLLIAHVARPAPRSTGVIELTPTQRLDREMKALDKRKERLDEYLQNHKPPGDASS